MACKRSQKHGPKTCVVFAIPNTIILGQLWQEAFPPKRASIPATWALSGKPNWVDRRFELFFHPMKTPHEPRKKKNRPYFPLKKLLKNWLFNRNPYMSWLLLLSLLKLGRSSSPIYQTTRVFLKTHLAEVAILPFGCQKHLLIPAKSSKKTYIMNSGNEEPSILNFQGFTLSRTPPIQLVTPCGLKSYDQSREIIGVPRGPKFLGGKKV